MGIKEWFLKNVRFDFKIPYWFLAVGPMLMFFTGFAMNAVVMALNHGQMPVLLPGCSNLIDMAGDIIHTCMTPASHLKILADWIVIRHEGIFSLGDMLELACDVTLRPFLFMWAALVLRDYSKNRFHQ